MNVIKRSKGEMKMEKTDILQELDIAEARLADDIQALAYIQQELDNTNNRYIDMGFIRNNIETLLKSMLFNQAEIKKVIQKNSY